MVTIIIDRFDLEEGKLNEIILNQVKALAKRTADNYQDLLKLKIGISRISEYE